MEDTESPPKSCLAVDGEGLYFRYGGRSSTPVLNGLNIAVDRGIIYGLLGPSGCGKTTLLRCIVGMYKPSSGTIRVYGRTPGQRGFSIPGPGVGFMPQELALFPEMTMEETLTFFGKLYQMSDKDIKERISFLAGLLDIPDTKKQIKFLSGGQQRRVSFATALIHKPPLLILDEPTVGVDPLLRKNLWDHLQKLARTDLITIIITTHYVEEARQAHVVGFMRDSHLLAEANPEALILKYHVSTLEDVFLKLCMKDSETSGSHTELEDSTDFNRDSKEEDVWVLHKDQERYNGENGVHRNRSVYDHHKVALLGDKADNGLTADESFCGQVRRANDRMRALINKSFFRLKRNIGLVFFQLFVPAVQVIVFCLCIGGQPFDLPVAVVNLETDPSGKSGVLLKCIDSHTIHQNSFSNLSLAYDSVRRGENWGVVYIGETFTDSLIDRHLLGIDVDNETIEKSTIKVYLDMTNQQIASTIFSKIMESFESFVQVMLEKFDKNPLLAHPPVVLGEPIYGTKDPHFTEFMAPGMMVGITYIMAIGLSSMSIIMEKKEGLLDRTWIAGVQYWEVVFSILITLFVMMILQITLVLSLTFLVFSIPSRGHLAYVVIAVLLVGLEGLSYGLFISAICSDENIAVMLTLGSFYPSILLSGIIWPVEAMPYFMRQLSYFLPLTYICHTVRCILSRGWDIIEKDVWVGYLAALSWIIPVIILSSLIFKYRK